MNIEILVPEIGESILEAIVANWLKQAGESVSEGETLVELETDKVMVEVPAPQSGVLAKIEKVSGDVVKVGQVLATISPTSKKEAMPTQVQQNASTKIGPAARKIVAEHQLSIADIKPTGPRNTITKDDVAQSLSQAKTTNGSTPSQLALKKNDYPMPEKGLREKREKMSPLRQRIAERLLQAQQQSAILTTFNEVDMSHVMALRSRYKESFRKKYGISLGFMSFFTKACIQALREIPSVNAELIGDEIIYKYYYDIGVAVSTDYGLVVPVVRNADNLRYIEIEQEIARLANSAKQRKLTVKDLTNGTFTITNGGVYGSMLSTPILNPPQTGILGIHNIIKRPVAINDQVEIRPMMYLALSYDHRLIDGRDAVLFLVKVKQYIEDPARLLLEI